MKMNLSKLCEACAGEVLNPCMRTSTMLSGLTWDSRDVVRRNVFVALPGKKVDGHDFLAQAVTHGARAVVVMKDPSPADLAVASEFSCAVVRVADTAKALTDLARAWRDSIDAKVVGITGSVGKTTTKDILSSICSTSLKTVSTYGNQNNELGVPATVLGADGDTEVLIVEMGMRGLGQISELCDCARPNIGVITKVGTAHLELLGSQENIALAKGEIVSSLPCGGTAVLCADDPFTPYILENCATEDGVEVLTFGLGENADFRAENVACGASGACSFQLRLPDGSYRPCALHIPGESAVLDALAAAAAAYSLGLCADKISEGMLLARSSSMRFEPVKAACGACLINDAYNASPDSMRSALSTFAKMSVPGRRIAVLGDMRELGPGEKRFHREVGIFAARSGLESLVCVGTLGALIAEAARNGGMKECSVHAFEGVAGALEHLVSELCASDTVLFKASRSVGLERIVKGLQ